MQLTKYYFILLDNFPIAKVLEEFELAYWIKIMKDTFPNSTLEVKEIW